MSGPGVMLLDEEAGFAGTMAKRGFGARMALGAPGHLTKPCDPEGLLERVRAAAGRP